jgi:hypothetical protein
MLKVNTLTLTRRLAGVALFVGLTASAGAEAAQVEAAPPEAPVTTICLSNACMPTQGAATVESRRLDRAALEQAYAALAVRGGLTDEQAARFLANLSRLTDAYEAKMARGGSAGSAGLSLAEVRSILGAAYADQAALAGLLIGQGQAVPFTRPVLGVGYGVTAEGVAVNSVTPDGPAARAGLAAGDVIALINGEPAADNTLTRDKTSAAPVVYTLTSGKVIRVTPGGYVP